MSQQERWLPVPGLETSYEVSDLGRVRGLDRVVRCYNSKYDKVFDRRLRGRMLALCPIKSGHIVVHLTDGEPFGVHVLVLRAFKGPPPPNCEGRHLNGDPSDNRLGNLRWGTRRRNIQDMKHHDGRANTKLWPGDIRKIKCELHAGASTRKLAPLFGVSRSTICDIKAGRVHADIIV